MYKYHNYFILIPSTNWTPSGMGQTIKIAFDKHISSIFLRLDFKKTYEYLSFRLKNSAYQKNIHWHDFSSESFSYIHYFFQFTMFFLVTVFSKSLLSISTTSQSLQMHKCSCGRWYFRKFRVIIRLYRFTIIRLDGLSSCFF